MGIKTVQDTSLTSVANAIRVKAEISGTLEFPDEFVSAIQNISTGITPSGTKTITENGTYDVTNFASADVNVSGGGGKNTQFTFGVDFVKSSIPIESGQSIEVAKSGTYDVYWNAVRQGTSGNYWTFLYIDGVQYGETQKAYIDNGYGQEVHFTGVTLTQGQTVSVRARSRTESYWTAVTGLTIIEA